MPVVTPVNDTVATLVLSLLQVPPAVLLVSAAVLPIQILGIAPAIVAGLGFTVTVAEVRQPVGNV